MSITERVADLIVQLLTGSPVRAILFGVLAWYAIWLVFGPWTLVFAGLCLADYAWCEWQVRRPV